MGNPKPSLKGPIKKEIKEESFYKKIDFEKRKSNTLRSLREVENFLCKTNKIKKGVCLFNFFR